LVGVIKYQNPDPIERGEEMNTNVEVSKTTARFRSNLILGMGILSILIDVIFLGWIIGIPAWLIAHRLLKKMSTGASSTDQKSLIKTGMILGIIGTFIWIPWIIFYFAY
jgi:hypothetical protein